MEAITKDTVSIILSKNGLKAVRSGHPWIYSKGISKINKNADSGDIAVLYDEKRKFAGLGLFDAHSPIMVRVLSSGKPVTLNRDFLKERIYSSIQKRTELINDESTTGYRLINGENDQLPAVVLDRYDETLVLKLDSVCWLKHLDILTEIFIELLNPERIVLRLSRSVKEFSDTPDGSVIYGEELNGQITFKENGILFYADPIRGQKTGFFIDQRENRAEVGKISRSKNVLNVFSYTGGFSICAAKNGALSVTSLDISRHALDGCSETFMLNDEKCPHEIICGDAFEEMEKLAKIGKKYDLVIVDPPSFARKMSDLEGALKAYAKVNILASKLVEKDGVLVAASCTARVSSDDFFGAVLRAVGSSGRPYKVIKKTGHALDHPVGFPEGAYLKCIYVKIQ
ncbi:MAG: class I SAM-dependent rRNA methyltransferase [Denitrovibrio sp.]|nr:MAG: class I SAM-dependent rRNA methyltransferase [Denitrovibrio sp.]